ncbi:bifunctional hydroxymethylpyrimidine kinase/phosphomethylpyrimidine kinase [Caldibacillus lycopersici]|uniref:Hydroxymethylpyrimidine/phosphomethylpyrimidine kinase n=1 Tax=Perspicuibacillus lycopersici TaxID=1325689 RepID=A0AAE3ITL7_9BACI|nr:bifunctional hydroxymethylpyrimidine kinase/phosphomethylpyrimidine kinase [Perspicuibacillus lycopersici]MCU9614390.1 bifunctional hydroxymethylpyrimidine kinase/phosphomethylpyrimidine kinase [Perspicuibacillus lycopersici]
MGSVYKALTIAGSDSGGGAGIQADLKTFQELHVFGMSALTAVTAQNTLGVQGIYPMTPEAVAAQIDSVANDMGTDALKTGMLFSAEIIQTVAEKVKHYGWKNLVVDPVMIAKGGASLLVQEAVYALKTYLLPYAYVITPNIPEAEVLTGVNIKTFKDRKEAAKILYGLGAKYVVIKGGHDENLENASDLLFDGIECYSFSNKRLLTKNTHGTGCTFSAAITAELAKGAAVFEAVSIAKQFITAAIAQDLEIGNGHGPTNHWAYKQKGAVSQ